MCECVCASHFLVPFLFAISRSNIFGNFIFFFRFGSVYKIEFHSMSSCGRAEKSKLQSMPWMAWRGDRWTSATSLCVYIRIVPHCWSAKMHSNAINSHFLSFTHFGRLPSLKISRITQKYDGKILHCSETWSGIQKTTIESKKQKTKKISFRWVIWFCHCSCTESISRTLLHLEWNVFCGISLLVLSLSLNILKRLVIPL